jgi:hypothetical protein
MANLARRAMGVRWRLVLCGIAMPVVSILSGCGTGERHVTEPVRDRLYTVAETKRAFAGAGLPLGPRTPVQRGGCTHLLSAQLLMTVIVCNRAIRFDDFSAGVVLTIPGQRQPELSSTSLKKANVLVHYYGRFFPDGKPERDFARIRHALSSLSVPSGGPSEKE